MEKIKFRVWFKGVKKFVYFGSPVIGMDCDKEWGIHFKADGGVVYLGGGDVMQFTGMVDEDGEEIYEGDIFEVTDGDGWVIGHILAEMNGETLSTDSRTIGAIIGNKHEHPEMVRQFCQAS